MNIYILLKFMRHILTTILLLFHCVCFGTYYSQSHCKQDEYLHTRFFKDKKDGFFIEIGAHDGVTYSNSCFFERELGWNGICVEPLGEAFLKLKKNRNCICIQGCISDVSGIQQLLKISCARINTEMLTGLKDKYYPVHLDRVKNEVKTYGGSCECLNIQCFTLNEILEKNGISHVDFLSVDTEGGELDILSSIDFDKYKIDLIVVADNYNDHRFISVLKKKGFQYEKKLGQDLLFISNEFRLKHPQTERPFLQLVTSARGMFSEFFSVLGAISLFEKGYLSGIHTNFGLDEVFGLYHDPQKGPNWWSYYFDNISLGSSENARQMSVDNDYEGYNLAQEIEFAPDRHEVCRLIHQYIHISQDVQDNVDNFAKDHFKGHPIIGIHYRGTDKWKEAPRTSYESMTPAINEALKTYGNNSKIFVATDEEEFYKYLFSVYPDKVLKYSSLLSKDGSPIHLSNQDNYTKGKEALIDCLLLSKCNILIRTSSNLSLCSGFFNPELILVDVTKRY